MGIVVFPIDTDPHIWYLRKTTRHDYFSWVAKLRILQGVPSWELTYPLPAGTFESMIFLFFRWDNISPTSLPAGTFEDDFPFLYIGDIGGICIRSCGGACHQNSVLFPVSNSSGWNGLKPPSG